MYGYKIKINSLPQIVWACETTVSNYEWHNHHGEDMLEISIASFDTQTVILNDKEFLLKHNALSCVVGTEKRTCFCNPETPITVVSVAVKLSDFQSAAGEITSADCLDHSVLLLPAVFPNPPLENKLEITTILHRLIRAYTEHSESGKAVLISGFFELLSKIDTIVRNVNLASNAKRHDYYIQKAEYIIECNYSQKITLQDVASELNISPVYLSAIYKKHTSVNFSEHLLNIRMNHAEKLLIDQNIPTSKIASLCGFCDEGYFRKKFKQFFGMNVREYRNIKNGLTLYHEKPQRKPDGHQGSF